ncbi:hypothetical protein K0M31_016969 [Melipona bicolor]|uniref:Uncharacterized protein n=1 Tax=Melipona bicolor TaxID=60889 RepID=A0AA40KE99_9HYME|nr:hypothetical protein K0M31_016969 [Melipona bicolor]
MEEDEDRRFSGIEADFQRNPQDSRNDLMTLWLNVGCARQGKEVKAAASGDATWLLYAQSTSNSHSVLTPQCRTISRSDKIVKILRLPSIDPSPNLYSQFKIFLKTKHVTPFP